MKKLLSLIICLALLTSVLVACTPEGFTHTYVGGVCTDCGETDPNYKANQDNFTAPCGHYYVNGVCNKCQAIDPNYQAPQDPNETSKDFTVVGNGNYLLADAEGNYGGALNRSKYGMGAPLNGEYDVENTIYYTVNDYYNMPSTSTRTIYTNFNGYQQQMRYTSGLASMVAVLNYWGESVDTTTELALLEQYQQLNAVDVYSQKGTTGQGLANLWQQLGYTVSLNEYTRLSSANRQQHVGKFTDWVEANLNAGKMMFVRGQDNMDNRWKVIIGYDSVGTDDWKTDDVIILADPYDGYDHNQDGYTMMAAGRFERWWQDVATSGVTSNNCECVVVSPKVAPTITRVSDDQDTTKVTQVVPENHLLRNPDGSYGGTRDESKYGAGTPLNGLYDHHDKNYHKFVDVYNLTSTDSLTVLTGYRAYSQTHASTCGICSVMSVLAYYGEDVTVYDELWLNNKYEELTGKNIKGSGVGSSGLKTTLSAAPLSYPGVVADSYSKENYKDESSMNFSTYDSFVKFLLSKLSKGTPLPISHRPHGGHWEVLIGYDNMGTDYIYDDIIILADSGDSWDHYQDGYNVYSATLFFRQWYNGSYTYNQQYVVFDKKV